ncbi:MAG: flagellar basal body-associated FliL family protein [Bdellovibrionales bacterium]|nr:flagellar basal body-associated FliL family protein [Bdellovibrionales bacterium]
MARPEEDEETEEAEATDTDSSRTTRTYLLWSLGLLVLAGVGGAGWYFYQARQVALERAEAERLAKENAVVLIEDPDNVLTGGLLRLDPIVVNLGAADQFFHLGLVFEYYDFALPEHVERQIPKVRDAAIQVLSGKTAEELLSVDGKSTLREELIAAANESIKTDHEIVDVYFTRYYLQ